MIDINTTLVDNDFKALYKYSLTNSNSFILSLSIAL